MDAPEGGTGNCRVQAEPGQILDVCLSQRGQRLGSGSPSVHPRSVGLRSAAAPLVPPDSWPLDIKWSRYNKDCIKVSTDI